MSHLVLSSLGTTTTATPTSRSPHTNHSTPYNQNSITSNRSSPVPKNSVNSRIIPQTMNPPIDMKSNNILNPEKTQILLEETIWNQKLLVLVAPAEQLPQTITTLVITIQRENSNCFIHKLYDMLHDESISHLIWWSPSLDSFYVTPGEEFSRVLSQYFKHTNIASFIRQLNMYGFHKVNEPF